MLWKRFATDSRYLAMDASANAQAPISEMKTKPAVARHRKQRDAKPARVTM